MWNAGPWRPCFVLLPVLTIDGEFTWGRCEVRELDNKYNDGHDARRDIQHIRQYRKTPKE